MDRRRFVPSPDGLEGRMLLSTARPASATLSARAPVANLSSTLQEKQLRIERLPFFLETLQPGRVLPGATIARLQADLPRIAFPAMPGAIHGRRPVPRRAFPGRCAAGV